MQKSLCSSKGGTSVAGYCTGPSDLQCCVTGGSSADYGVDISTAQSVSTMSCFKSSGYGSYIIPRGYKSTGAVDSNVCTNLNNAKSAGIAVRDVYMFPCPTCSKSASTQMSELVSYLKSNCASAWSGRVWLDIEGSQYWTGSTSSNKSWYQNLVNSCSTYGVRCGVYSSYYQWQAIFGSTSYSYGSNLPLWYAHYDNNPSFSDFSAFGGWSSPHTKQYAGDVTLCSAGVDKNYAKSF
jgi:GH25 family lysozyme M1 (1,4-beta-N-acetylmuramidase)